MKSFLRILQLLRRQNFRRVFIVRVLTQGADAVVQVGMASYVLLNPQNQPNAWAIAGVLALVTLPFGFVGPFLSPLLDRFWRQRTIVICDVIRVVLSVIMAWLVATDHTTGAGQVALFLLLLVTLSINRLQLAGFAAGLPHTFEQDEYVEASSVAPVIGPLAAVIFGGAAGVMRLLSQGRLEANHADGLIFVFAGILFLLATLLMTRLGKRSLGPQVLSKGKSAAEIWSGLREAAQHLWQRRPALVGFVMLFGTKIGYGFLMTSVIVLHRNYFYPDSLDDAMIGIGVWFLVSGIGYAISGAVAVPTVARFGLRRAVIIMVAAAAIFQLLVSVAFGEWTLVAAGFALGVCTQSVKICSDTLVQAHIDDDIRGRVMVLYDITNNLGIVAGATAAAIVLPADGYHLIDYLGMAVVFALLALWFYVVTKGQDELYDRGTVGSAPPPGRLED